jgi:hypothetical protein
MARSRASEEVSGTGTPGGQASLRRLAIGSDPVIRQTRRVERVLVLGPGGAGKSTLAARLGRATGLPVIELDRVFWTPELDPTPKPEWVARQIELMDRPGWIMDGDLGPYDVLEPRLEAADTIVVLDLPRWRCAWRAVRRSHQRIDFWRWLWRWPTEYRPRLMAAIATHAGTADVWRLSRSDEIERFIGGAGRDGRPPA